MKKLLNHKVLRIVLMFTALLIFAIVILVFNKTDLRQSSGRTGNAALQYERAKVLGVNREELEEDQVHKGIKRGSQNLELEILTGDYKGETVTVENYISALYSVICKENTHIIVTVSNRSDGTYNVSVYSYDRANFLYALVAIFFVMMALIGGKKGVKSVLGLLFTFVCIFTLFVPMLYRGYSPILSSLLIVSLTTCVCLWLLNGFSIKTASAIIGTILGVMIAGIISSVSGQIAHLTGFNMNEAESLLLVAQDYHMQVRGLLFASILISSLGAVMDMAMSIASTLFELYDNSPNLSRKSLFLSGMNVGHDMMGTMTNTLIFAFTGSSLNMLILIYSYNVPYYQLINTNMLGIEMIQAISGSIAVVLTVPMVAFVSAQLITRFNQSDTKHKVRVENKYVLPQNKNH
jgi:uncharacterized membrane protein